MVSPVFAITRHELHRRRLYLLWWSIGIIALILLTVLAYGAVKDQAGELNKAFGNLSSNISGFVGTSDMFSPVGYLNSQLYYITLPILFILLSITLAGSLVRKEETNATLELLLARPVSRSQLLAAKALAGTLIVAILATVAAVCTILCSYAVNIGISAESLAFTTFWMALFSGAFGAVAFMLYAASVPTRRAAAAVAILLSLGGYVISSLGGMVHQLSWAAKLFPYHYYDSGSLLQGHLPRGLSVYTVAIYIIALLVAFAGFRRRDISS